MPKLPDLLQIAVGGEYTPGGNTALTYPARILYRAGARYGRLPREDAPKPLTELMLTLGAGLPVGSAFEERHSTVNLSLAVGTQAAPAYAATDGLYGGSPAARKLAFEVGIGFTYNTKYYGKIGRGNCPIPSCHVRLKHMHGGVEYTGQPWYKKQNPRIGENLPDRKPDERPVRTPKRERY
ncbi:MAG: hypothetical protein H7330_15465 [Hymenobacteraceae bacterium]|nr:hypothetical protein [Hymenobacteraceae bacterium]